MQAFRNKELPDNRMLRTEGKETTTETTAETTATISADAGKGEKDKEDKERSFLNVFTYGAIGGYAAGIATFAVGMLPSEPHALSVAGFFVLFPSTFSLMAGILVGSTDEMFRGKQG